ncbi:hypothetical protein IAT38_004119 [Cryptococcus sp. DSM 104549]
MFPRAVATTARSLRPLARRTLHTRPTPPSSSVWSTRNAVVAGTTLVVSALALTSDRQRVLNDSRVRESVLDQPSLKEPIHRREEGEEVLKDSAVETKTEVQSEAPADEATKLLEDKEAQAAEPAQGAFNPETGEINWDCPCLGGMATGPCGEQFKAAFSCFVYSEAEPKGVDCVEKFKLMQDCFREHPDVYGEEIDDDEAPLDPVEGDAPPAQKEEEVALAPAA